MKPVLVDSNEDNLSQLNYLLEFYRVFEPCIEFSDVNEANQFILSHEVDVVFINADAGDAQFSGDGTFLAYNLMQNKEDLMVVLFSDTEEGPYRAFQSQCLEYMQLPFDGFELQRVVERLTKQWKLLEIKRESTGKSIMIKTKSGYQLIKIADILFIERMERKNYLVTTEGERVLLSGYSMDELEQLFSNCGFFRCYQAFIVNLSKVSFVKVNTLTKNYSITFQDFEGEVILSREKYAKLMQLLKEKYANINL